MPLHVLVLVPTVHDALPEQPSSGIAPAGEAMVTNPKPTVNAAASSNNLTLFIALRAFPQNLAVIVDVPFVTLSPGLAVLNPLWPRRSPKRRFPRASKLDALSEFAKRCGLLINNSIRL